MPPKSALRNGAKRVNIVEPKEDKQKTAEELKPASDQSDLSAVTEQDDVQKNQQTMKEKEKTQQDVEPEKRLPLEHGPLSIKDAATLISNRYNGVFKSIHFSAPPVVTDGCVCTFNAGGVMVAQCKLRVGVDIVLDNNQNAFLQVFLYDVRYPKEPFNVQIA